MRFDRREKIEGFCWTDRKKAAYQRKISKALEKANAAVPLFAGLIAVPAPLSPEAEEVRRNRLCLDSEQYMRDSEAKGWRKGRQLYFACSPEIKAAIRAEWRNWRGPARPTYFIYVVEKHNGDYERRRQRISEQEAEIRRTVSGKLAAQQQIEF